MRRPEQVNLGSIRFHPVSKADFEVDGYEHEQIAVVDKEEKRVLGFHNEQNYSLIRHQKVVKALRDLTENKLISGNYHFSKDRNLFLYYYPQGKEYMVEINGQTFKVGVRITNSYDGTRALKAELVAMEMTSGMGMYTKGLIGRSYHRHTRHSGDMEKFKVELEDLLDFDEDELRELVKKAQQTYMDRDDTLEAIRIPEKLVDLVKQEADDGYISAWELYQTLARKITVVEDEYEEATLEQLHREANKIFKADVKEIDIRVEGDEDDEDEEEGE